MAPQIHVLTDSALDLRMHLGEDANGVVKHPVELIILVSLCIEADEEGCVWDTITQQLYFIDIDLNTIYVYNPTTQRFGYTVFDKNVTAIALLRCREGFIAALQDSVAIIPPTSVPVADLDLHRAPDPLKPSDKKGDYEVIVSSECLNLREGEARLNEGAVDPAGRFIFGSMTFNVGTSPGRLWSVQVEGEAAYKCRLIQNGISVTNGMAWRYGGKNMIFTDSHPKEILAFDYDLVTGGMSNRKVFSQEMAPEYGYPDGLCVDDQGGVWSARWESGKVLRLNPRTGEIDVEIRLSQSWNVTCCVFGGPDLSDLYITTARCSQGSLPPAHLTEMGKLYVVKDIGYRGLERGRFLPI